MSLDLDDAGFDYSVLCEFRRRLLDGGAADRLLTRVLEAARQADLLRARGRQRTDSTHVVAAIRTMNRLELVGETLRAALNAIAVKAPDWLRSVVPHDWHARYDRRFEEWHLRISDAKRGAYIEQIGTDGFLLLDALSAEGPPQGIADLPEVALLRRVWARQLERVEPSEGGGSGARLRPVQGRGPGDRVDSPYDAEARFRSKSGKSWSGYMVHLTETCDEGSPRLVVHTDTTPANVHEGPRTMPIHDALAAKGLVPAEHLVDSAYVGAAQLVEARTRHGIDLIGPGRRDVSWQGRSEGAAFSRADFKVDWDRRVAICTEGKEATNWTTVAKTGHGRTGKTFIHVAFRAADCRPCPSRSRCTRARSPYVGRAIAVLHQPEDKALAAARALAEAPGRGRIYAQRQGIEGTISQGVRAFGLRHARYRSLAKTALQHVATAAAVDLDRIAAWLTGRPLAPTRTSRFAALAT